MAVGQFREFSLNPKCMKGNGIESNDHTEIDNSEVTLQKLTQLLQTSELSDLQLVVGSRFFYVHKLILCMSSAVLRVMLSNPQWPEFYLDRIVLKEEPECVAVFDKFLKYLYSGRTQLSPESALPLLTLADKYGVSELSEQCVNYMGKNTISAIRGGYMVSWLRYSHLCGYSDLENTCKKMMTWNFKEVAVSPDFCSMQKDTLLEFLKSSDIVISDEFSLFQATKRWLLSQKASKTLSCSDFKNLVLQVLSLIRFPLVPLHYHNQLQSDDFTQVAKEFFQEKINLGIKYHTQSMESRVAFESSSNVKEKYFPRNYTCEMWNTTLTIENFSCMCERMIRLLYFSSPITASFADRNFLWEWQMEFYPKGVLFGPSMMIGLQSNYSVPLVEYDIVRVAIKAETTERKHVEISVLAVSEDDECECISQVSKKRFVFDNEDTVCNIDNIVPFTELNESLGNSEFLIGENRDSFKIMIIIKPLG